jgi:hypothetical protein
VEEKGGIGQLVMQKLYETGDQVEEEGGIGQLVMHNSYETGDQVEEKGGIGQLRKKYVRLVKVALTVQNMLEDFADTLERMHAFINWADPWATLIFIFICLGGCLAIAAFSLPVVLSLGLCWTVPPPPPPLVAA